MNYRGCAANIADEVESEMRATIKSACLSQHVFMTSAHKQNVTKNGQRACTRNTLTEMVAIKI